MLFYSQLSLGMTVMVSRTAIKGIHCWTAEKPGTGMLPASSGRGESTVFFFNLSHKNFWITASLFSSAHPGFSPRKQCPKVPCCTLQVPSSTQSRCESAARSISGDQKCTAPHEECLPNTRVISIDASV